MTMMDEVVCLAILYGFGKEGRKGGRSSDIQNDIPSKTVPTPLLLRFFHLPLL
jgi:hypothetical protein